MKCPNCGLDIPEGHMYCDSCGTEINFVPDFEPEVENEINATLSGVADELNKEERKKEERGKRTKRIVRKARTNWKLILVGVATTALIVLCIFLFMNYNSKSIKYYMRMAEEARRSGNYKQAVEYLTEANEEFPENTDIIFRLSDYYLEMGDYDAAVDTLMQIVESPLFPDDKVLTAYESIVSIYRQSGDKEKLAMILDSEDKALGDMKEDMVPNKPVMSQESGVFDMLTLSIEMPKDTEGTIYYTVNDGMPDENSIPYEGEIILDAEGIYEIKAVVINEYGVSSEMVENQYVIEKGAPDAPEIMEASGEYNQNTMIVAVVQPGTSIFYTTDGSDPTTASKQYVSPIIMPMGRSHFRFVACDNDGNYSEIVDREYHLVFTRLVSKEQAVNSLVETLVRLGLLLDPSGLAIGVDGHYEYIYNSVIEVEGAGEYYMVDENHVYSDGTTVPTGLIYAINTHDGTVNRLGYDSSGNYTLITISNR